MSDAVLIPVFNEAAHICDVLDEVRRRFDGSVVVIDDGSTDGTSELLAARSDVVTLTHDRNLGYGSSLIDGFEWAAERGVERLVTMDADRQHEPAHIIQFLGALSTGWDVISGTRYHLLSGANGDAPQDRVRINRIITAEVNRVTGWRLTDSFCGFKAYRVASLARLGLSESGYGMCMEFWARAYAAGLSVRELPVERIYVDHGRSFGESLEDPEVRLAYYLGVWGAALPHAVA